MHQATAEDRSHMEISLPILMLLGTEEHHVSLLIKQQGQEKGVGGRGGELVLRECPIGCKNVLIILSTVEALHNILPKPV